MARSKRYQDFLVEQLKDHDEPVVYLNAALEESLLSLFVILQKHKVSRRIAKKHTRRS